MGDDKLGRTVSRILIFGIIPRLLDEEEIHQSEGRVPRQPLKPTNLSALVQVPLALPPSQIAHDAAHIASSSQDVDGERREGLTKDAVVDETVSPKPLDDLCRLGLHSGEESSMIAGDLDANLECVLGGLLDEAEELTDTILSVTRSMFPMSNSGCSVYRARNRGSRGNRGLRAALSSM